MNNNRCSSCLFFSQLKNTNKRGICTNTEIASGATPDITSKLDYLDDELADALESKVNIIFFYRDDNQKSIWRNDKLSGALMVSPDFGCILYTDNNNAN